MRPSLLTNPKHPANTKLVGTVLRDSCPSGKIGAGHGLDDAQGATASRAIREAVSPCFRLDHSTLRAEMPRHRLLGTGQRTKYLSFARNTSERYDKHNCSAPFAMLFDLLLFAC
jgi:hypothetical protein